MAFILIAPGVRDVIASAEAFAHRPVDETRRTEPTRRSPAPEVEHQPTEQQMLNLNQQAEHAQHLYQQTSELPHERAPALLAEQIMKTPVVTLGPDASIRQAWDLFRQRAFRHVPVIDAGGRIIGILSERDLLLDAAGLARGERRAHTTIRPLLTHPVLSATANTEVREIAKVLFERHIGAVPILNNADAPIGIVSRSDILKALVTQAPLELWV